MIVVDVARAGACLLPLFARTAEMSEYKTLGEFLNGVEPTAVQPAPVRVKALSVAKPRAATLPRIPRVARSSA